MLNKNEEYVRRPPTIIAIADDEALQRYALRHMISTFIDCELVIESSNGQDLINKIELADTKPDICILDIGMPVMNGFATLPILKEKWPAIKVIVSSVHSSKFNVYTMLNYGADGFLPKSDGLERLKDAIVDIRTHGSYYSHSIPKALFEKAKKTRLDVPEITEREMEALTLICNDLSYEEIAKQMSISKRTVEVHRDNLYKKLNVGSKTELLKFALQNELFLLDNMPPF